MLNNLTSLHFSTSHIFMHIHSIGYIIILHIISRVLFNVLMKGSRTFDRDNSPSYLHVHRIMLPKIKTLFVRYTYTSRGILRMVMRRTLLLELSMRARKRDCLCAMTTFRSRRSNFHRLTDLPAYTYRDQVHPRAFISLQQATSTGRT